MRLIVNEKLRRVAEFRANRRKLAEQSSDEADRGLIFLDLFLNLAGLTKKYNAHYELGPGETLRGFILRLCSVCPPVSDIMSECGFHPHQFAELYERCRFTEAEITEQEFARFKEGWRMLFMFFNVR